MKLTSIISVNYNQPEVTVAFLNSISKNDIACPIEVILVDNGCQEDHHQKFLDAFPGLVYIRSDKNLGFAGGNNLGIKIAKGDFLLLLNNDTEITENLITELSNQLESNEEIGMISPLLLYFDNPNTIQYAGFTKMNYITGRNSAVGFMDIDTGQYDNVSMETGYCHGAAMMCRRKDLSTIGLMEEQFFLYYEELDWCEKFKKAGKKIWFTGRTKVYHKESISVGKESSIKTYFMTRNRMLFMRRNTSAINSLVFSVFYILFACPKQLFFYMKKGRTDLMKWTIKGVIWNLLHSKNSKDLGFKI